VAQTVVDDRPFLIRLVVDGFGNAVDQHSAVLSEGALSAASAPAIDSQVLVVLGGRRKRLESWAAGASSGRSGTSDLPAISFGRAWTRGVTDGAGRDLATAGEWAAAKPSPLEPSRSKAFIGSASATPVYLPASSGLAPLISAVAI
jgi:hypothetical protein